MDQSLKARAFIICLVLVAGLSALSIRLINVQVWDRKMSSDSKFSRFKLVETRPARRGYIVDRHGQVLAQNRPEAALIADVNHLETFKILTRAVAHRYASQVAGWKNATSSERADLLAKTRKQIVARLSKEEVLEQHLEYATEVIGRELRMPSTELRKRVKSGKKRVVVKKSIREDLARRIEVELKERSIQGFSFDRKNRRTYPMPTMAVHTIGYANHEGIGQTGIERAMNEILAGKDGQSERKRDANGLVIPMAAEKIRPAMHGKNVKLTLDMGIQAIVEDELGMACDAYNAKQGSIVVVDPHTGDILAIASRPHFNLNVRENVGTASNNFAVSAVYESGSVMKIVPMSAALDQGVATRESVVDCGWGKLKRYGFTINDPYPYGELTFDGVLVKSSNIGTFQFADRVGRAKFYEYLDAYGFGQKTGFSLPGEQRGVIRGRTNMRNFASAGYGYSVSVTPLQLAMAYSTLANGGVLLKPRLVDSIIANNGTVLQKEPVTKIRRVISERTAADMLLALEQVVKKGTGRRAQIAGYRFGGKTGTAEKWDNEIKDYSELRKYCTFAGIGPIGDPRFVCIVTIDEPSDLGDAPIGGGTIAAPVFSQVAARVAAFMNLPATEPVDNEGSVALNPQ